MFDGATVSTFLIVFREALEASLIIGIILTVLARLNQKKYFPIRNGPLLFEISVGLVGISTHSIQTDTHGSSEHHCS